MTSPADRTPNPTLRKIRQVFDACDQLTAIHGADGWGQDDLHRMVGGSLETIVPLRKLWNSYQALRHSCPETSTMVVSEVLQMINDKMAKADTELADRWHAFLSTHDAAHSELIAKYEATTTRQEELLLELKDAQSTVDSQNLQISDLTADVERFTKAVVERDNHLRAQEEKLSSLTEQIAGLEQQVATALSANAKHERELQNAATTIASLQSRAETLVAEHDKALAALRQGHQNEVAEERQAAKTALAEARREEREERDQALNRLRESHDAEISRLHQRATETEAQLRRSLSEAEQRAATLEGRSAVLEKQLDDARRGEEELRLREEKLRVREEELRLREEETPKDVNADVKPTP